MPTHSPNEGLVELLGEYGSTRHLGELSCASPSTGSDLYTQASLHAGASLH